MELKPGVRVAGIRPEIMVAMMIAYEVFRGKGLGKDMVITAITDGKHRKDSKHYIGQAIDIRTRDLDAYTQKDIVATMQIKLGADYDVVLEGDHLHIEFDPE